MGRKRQRHKKSTKISETEEREKIKESILKVFRARLTLPDQGGALVVGPSKQHDRNQERKYAAKELPSGYSTDKSSSSMSGRDNARKKKSSVKRRKHSSKSKNKSEKTEKEASAAVTKHMKVARGVSYSLRPGKEAVTDKGISSMITHSRITQQVGLVNTGKKSAAVSRAPLQVPEHIRKQTEEELRKIVENNDDSIPPIADIDEAQSRILSQSSRGTKSVTPASVEMKPQNNTCSTIGSIPNHSPADPLDRFTEVLPLKETVASLISSLKTVNKQMYPGRNCLTEATDELLKLMKQNAPRSATPTPIPVLNKITNSGSIQRKLVDQFPPENSEEGGRVCPDLQREKGVNLLENSNRFSYNKLPQSFHFTDVNPFHPLTQNTGRDKAEGTNVQTNSLQNYKETRPQPDHNLKLLANVLNKLHKDSGNGKENIGARNNRSETFNGEKNQYQIEMEAFRKRDNQKVEYTVNHESKNSMYNYVNNEIKPAETQPVYVLKKQKAPNNLQILYESAKLLQRQHRDPREDIRNELFKEELDKIFASSKKPERREKLDIFLDCGKKDQKREFSSMFNTCNSAESKNTKGSHEIVKILEENAKKGLDPVDVQCEPMEVDDKIMDQEAKTLLQINDRKRMEVEAIDMLRTQAGLEGGLTITGRSFLDTGLESHSQGSSQCSHCSCTTSSRYSGSQHGDILNQVVAKETEYMPSFHGGYYRDQLNVQDLMYGQKNNKELQVGADAMDILDYIDDRPENRQMSHPSVQPSLHPVLKVRDHLGRYQPAKLPDLHSPDEPKLYPRHMY